MLYLIHGLGVDHRMWLFQMRRLQGNTEVDAPDLPAFGGVSPLKNDGGAPMEGLADWLAAKIEAERPGEKVSIAGYSMGGTVALLTALRHPGLVKSLALVCSSASWSEGRRWARPLVYGPMARVSASCLGVGMKLAIRRLVSGERDRAILRDMIGKADIAASAKLLREMAVLDLRPRLKEIEVPVAVIGAKRDFLAPPSHQRALAEGIRNSTLHMVPGVGHYYCVQKPDDLAGRLAVIERL